MVVRVSLKDLQVESFGASKLSDVTNLNRICSDDEFIEIFTDESPEKALRMMENHPELGRYIARYKVNYQQSNESGMVFEYPQASLFWLACKIKWLIFSSKIIRI